MHGTRNTEETENPKAEKPSKKKENSAKEPGQ